MSKKVAFVSALGGQGCTLAAAYVAKAAACDGHPVTLADLGGFGGSLAYVLGVGEESVMNLNDVVSGECQPEDALVECGENLTLMPSGCFSADAVSPDSPEVIGVIEELSKNADVFADLPAGIVPDMAMTECFDMFVICTRTDVLSLRFASALCRHLRRTSAKSDKPCEIRLLLTRFNPEYMRAGEIADIDQCIDIVGARLTGVLPQDIEAMSAVMSGQPPDETCDLMAHSRDTARRIYGARVPLDSSKPFRLRI